MVGVSELPLDSRLTLIRLDVASDPTLEVRVEPREAPEWLCFLWGLAASVIVAEALLVALGIRLFLAAPGFGGIDNLVCFSATTAGPAVVLILLFRANAIYFRRTYLSVVPGEAIVESHWVGNPLTILDPSTRYVTLKAGDHLSLGYRDGLGSGRALEVVSLSGGSTAVLVHGLRDADFAWLERAFSAIGAATGRDFSVGDG